MATTTTFLVGSRRLLMGFISSANFDELLISNSPEELVEMVVCNERPSDENWTERLGL